MGRGAVALIGQAVSDVGGGLLNIWTTIPGLLNSFAWSSTIVYALLPGARYCLSTGSSAFATLWRGRTAPAPCPAVGTPSGKRILRTT